MNPAKKKHSVLRNLLIDLVCAGLALVVFALEAEQLLCMYHRLQNNANCSLHKYAETLS